MRDVRWTPAFQADLLAIGASKAFEVQGRSILICRAAEAIYAVANRCTHAAMPLEGGRIRGRHISCPVHGARFDLATGAGSGLAQAPIQTFPVLVRDAFVFVAV